MYFFTSHSFSERTVPTQLANTSGQCPSRNHRLPLRYRDVLPEVLPPSTPSTSSDDQLSRIPCIILHVFDSFRTAYNAFGIARDYRHRPTYDPDSFISIHDLSDLPHSSNADPSLQDPPTSSKTQSPPWPWENMSIWRLMSWKLTGSSQKSNAEVTRLVREVIQAPDFSIDDLIHFKSTTESRRLDDASQTRDSSAMFDDDGWKEATVEISIPTRDKQPKAGHSFFIPRLMYRPLTSVIKTAFSEPLSKFFHLTPFKRIWRSPSGHDQRLYDELYTSDAWNKAHDEVQKQRRTDGCQLERIVAGMMFWSDSTQLAQFGHASAWPVYLFFGNLSKYIRASPGSGACHPIAFIPSVRGLFHTTDASNSCTHESVTRLPRELPCKRESEEEQC